MNYIPCQSLEFLATVHRQSLPFLPEEGYLRRGRFYNDCSINTISSSRSNDTAALVSLAVENFFSFSLACSEKMRVTFFPSFLSLHALYHTVSCVCVCIVGGSHDFTALAKSKMHAAQQESGMCCPPRCKYRCCVFVRVYIGM